MTAAPPVSVRRNSRSGVSSRRTQAVRSEKESAVLANGRARVGARGATRSRTCGATSSMKIRSVSGSGGAIRRNVPKPEVQREVRQDLRPVLGRADDRLVGVARRRGRRSR